MGIKESQYNMLLKSGDYLLKGGATFMINSINSKPNEPLMFKVVRVQYPRRIGSDYSIALNYENIFRQFDDIDRFIFSGFLKGGAQYSGSQERAVLRKAFQIEKFRIMHSSHSSHIPLI